MDGTGFYKRSKSRKEKEKKGEEIMEWVRYDDVMGLLQEAREEGPCDIRSLIWRLDNLDSITTDDDEIPHEIKAVTLNSRGGSE